MFIGRNFLILVFELLSGWMWGQGDGRGCMGEGVTGLRRQRRKYGVDEGNMASTKGM